MIKTIIFDIGGVVTLTDFDATYRNFAKRIGASPELVASYHEKNIKALILGTLSFDDFCNEMKQARGNATLDLKKVWIEEMLKVRTVDREVLETIANLRKTYSVGTLTNLTESRFIVDTETGIYDNFDYTVFSFIEHLEKPDSRFYEIALKKAGAKAEEAIFVDDQVKCTDAAEGLGIRSVLFTNNADLLIALKRLGVNV